MIPGVTTRRRFADLTEQQVLALAISSEEDDARIYRQYAERLRGEYPGTAAVFDGMAAEEDVHRQRLIDLHKARFGAVIPLIRREHVSGFYARRPVWLVENLGIERIHDAPRAADVHAAIHDDRRRLHAAACRHVEIPGKAELIDVVAVDLV